MKNIKINLKLICLLLVTIIFFGALIGSINHSANADTDENENYRDIYNNDLVFTPIDPIEKNVDYADNSILNTVDESDQISTLSIDNDIDCENEIIKQLEAAGSDVETELNNQIESYKLMLKGAVTQSEQNQIQKMIDDTQYQLNKYLNIKNPEGASLYADSAQSELEILIPMALAYFKLNDYELSYELLNHAWGDIGPNTYYAPMYGKRVLASLITYDLFFSDSNNGRTSFPSGLEGAYNQDLYLAIHDFDYVKLSDKASIHFEDDYDFDSSGHGPIIDYLIKKFDYLMNIGVLTKFKVAFTINVYDYLYVSTHSKKDNKWLINVTNYSNGPLDVMYNSRMVTKGNARYWTNLDYIKVFTMPARTSTVVEIEEQWPACYVTFSHIKKGTRYITYANDLSETNPDSHISLPNGSVVPKGYLCMSGNTKAHYGNTEDLSILSEIGTFSRDLIVKITNPFDSTATVKYNTKMCSYEDAERWRNLSDIQSFTLAPGQSKIVVIYANFFATTVAARITTYKDDRILYANELDPYCCHMNLQRASYLKVTNCGKSSGWQIDVYNPTNNKVTVYYNTKLCFESDAEDWKNLQDVAEIEIQPYQTKRIVIKTNWFAKTIAISYYCFGHRAITYAYDLDNGNNMTVKYNCV